MIEVRREPPDGPAAQALFAAYMALVRERLGPEFEPTEDIFATASDFEGPGAAFLVLYEDGQAVGCGALRPAGPHAAEIKRMFVAAGARGRGHGRRLLAELEAIARADGRRRVRVYTTGVLTEARALYAAEGYTLASTRRDGDREDYWLEKKLAG